MSINVTIPMVIKSVIAIIATTIALFLVFFLVQNFYHHWRHSPHKYFPYHVARFTLAAQKGDIAKMKKLYAKGNIDINYFGEKDFTPLMWTMLASRTQENTLKSMQAMMDMGADPNVIVNNGKSAIYMIAGFRFKNPSLKSSEMLRLLLKNGGNPNIVNPNNKQTVLYEASNDLVGLENLQILIEHGADVNLRNHKGDLTSTLSNAVRSKEYTKALYLLDKGAVILPQDVIMMTINLLDLTPFPGTEPEHDKLIDVLATQHGIDVRTMRTDGRYEGIDKSLLLTSIKLGYFCIATIIFENNIKISEHEKPLIHQVLMEKLRINEYSQADLELASKVMRYLNQPSK